MSEHPISLPRAPIAFHKLLEVVVILDGESRAIRPLIERRE